MSNPTTPFSWQMPQNTDLVTDLPADFEVFGQAVATSMQDLLGGTTGQVLAKASNADMDFVWSADAAGMTNPMTTTGDSIYSSSGSTPARLGIGSAGQVLTVAGGLPSWATAASGALTLITPTSIANSGGTATLSGAVTTASGVTSVSINGVFSATYANYLISYNEFVGSATIDARLRFRVSGTDNTAANYYWADMQCTYSGTAGTASNAADTTFRVNLNNTSTIKSGALLQVFSPNVATQKTVQSFYANSSQMGHIGAYHSGTIQADGFTFFTSANTLSGILRVYGIQN